ncbi:MAG: HAD-IIB family hydrolase [bacterium]|nr:HAD-IIB family hydrolase [bacterium]
MVNLINKIEEVPKDKKLIVFDLDRTLAESKFPIDQEMASLLGQLLQTKKVAVIGGGKYDLFQRQLSYKLNGFKELLINLFLFPMTATSFYKYENNKWIEVYSQYFSKEEKEEITSAFEKTFQELNYKHPEKIYGELIEDRGAEITFSVFGQEAPLELKEKWSKSNHDIRPKMEEVLQKHLPDMEVKIAGLTSIDVTRKGIDKGYGIHQIEKYLNVSVEEMLFVGDDFNHEGNDEAALKTGVLCFEVKNPEETKSLISSLVS